MMQLGAAGKALIQSFESCRLEAYQDERGVWTIGYGHTGPEVVKGYSCSQAQADSWFLQDTGFACRAVNSGVTVRITQNEFDALVSFTFNVGAGSLAHSTMLRMLNASNYQGAADQFAVWNHVNGQVDAGLTRRRAAEQALFVS